MKYIKIIISAIVVIALMLLLNDNSKLKKGNEILHSNIEVLYDSITKYKVADSLNAAQIAELQFSKKELLRLYNEDKNLIEQMTKNAKLQTVEKIETTTHDTIKVKLQDTLLITLRDTVLIDSAKYFKYNSTWSDVDGYIVRDSISLNIANRESLLITESSEKKKFWFIRLPGWLFGYKNKRLDVVSRNPNTQIQSVEYINIH